MIKSCIRINGHQWIIWMSLFELDDCDANDSFIETEYRSFVLLPRKNERTKERKNERTKERKNEATMSHACKVYEDEILPTKRHEDSHQSPSRILLCFLQDPLILSRVAALLLERRYLHASTPLCLRSSTMRQSALNISAIINRPRCHPQRLGLLGCQKR